MYPRLVSALAAYNAKQANTLGMDTNDVIGFVGGLVMGLVNKDDLGEIRKCLNNVGVLQSEIQQAIGDFEKSDLTDIVNGVEIVGEIILQLPGDLSDCTSIQGDIARISNWGKIFTNPSQLITVVTSNVLMHWA